MRFKTAEARKKHEEKHQQKVVHECKDCKKTYTTLQNLKDHNCKANPIKERKFTCDVKRCGKAFTSSKLRNEHMVRIHNIGPGGQKYKKKVQEEAKCEKCGKVFSSIGNKKMHAKKCKK